jgi:hypothetical protein
VFIAPKSPIFAHFRIAATARIMSRGSPPYDRYIWSIFVNNCLSARAIKIIRPLGGLLQVRQSTSKTRHRSAINKKEKGKIRGQFAYTAKYKGEAKRELIFSAILFEWQDPHKKIPGDKPGTVRGKNLIRQKNLVQPRPANQLNRTPLQIKILCQHCLNISHVGVIIHRPAEFNDAAEFIAAAIICVGEPELCEVLC